MTYSLCPLHCVSVTVCLSISLWDSLTLFLSVCLLSASLLPLLGTQSSPHCLSNLANSLLKCPSGKPSLGLVFLHTPHSTLHPTTPSQVSSHFIEIVPLSNAVCNSSSCWQHEEKNRITFTQYHLPQAQYLVHNRYSVVIQRKKEGRERSRWSVR